MLKINPSKSYKVQTQSQRLTYPLQRQAGSMPSSSELEYQPETNCIQLPDNKQ